MYLKREIDQILIDWRRQSKRKPLLLRGARQVGKTRTVRELGKSFEHYIEINFEESQSIHALFEDSLSPQDLIENLTAVFNTSIRPGKTLIFFDEIQACIPAIRSLRFFAEKMPDLHLIAAGSLLEFALEEIPSFGVGRIRSMFMYPMSFDEFLTAIGENILLSQKNKASPTQPLAGILHKKLLSYLSKFLMLGGMPEIILTYVETKDFSLCNAALDDLIVSFNDDFVKYKKRVPSTRIREVFDSVVKQAGSKFVFSKAATQSNHLQIKEALNLLVMAGLVIPVIHTAANGLPLGAEVNPKKQKMLLFDTGIFLRILNLDISDMLLSNEFSMINKGNVAEQFIGLEMMKHSSVFRREQLYYWHREANNSHAEVDYLLVSKGQIVPLEVKAGTKGSMQSLYLFLKEKKRPYGMRISSENFARYDKIQVYPLYAVNNLMNA